MRWLNPQVGTGAATDPSIGDAKDAVIIDVRDLVDREGNLVDDVRSKIHKGVTLLSAGHRVIVCCDYGLSRSNAIAIGILAASSGKAVDETMETLRGVDGLDEIRLDVLDAVRRALHETRRRSGQGGAVAVTGASGFVGAELIQAAQWTRPVVPIKRDVADLGRGAMALEAIARQEGVDTIVHLAHPRIITTNGSLAEAVAMMKTVIDVCSVTGARLVYVSSWEVFSGYGVSDIVADERLPPRPLSVYGQGKALCEVLLGYASQARGLRGCIVRAGPVFGDGSDRPRFLRTFTRHAISGDPIVTHLYDNGRPALDLMHIDDVVDGLARIASQEVTGIFHLGTGMLTSTKSIAEIVRRSTGADVAIEERSIGANVTNVSMDSHRALAELGWRPRKDVRSELNALVKRIAFGQGSEQS